MIIDNHIATSTIQEMLDRIKDKELNIPIQIEIDKISQITQSAITVANGFLLDNMPQKKLKSVLKKSLSSTHLIVKFLLRCRVESLSKQLNAIILMGSTESQLER